MRAISVSLVKTNAVQACTFIFYRKIRENNDKSFQFQTFLPTSIRKNIKKKKLRKNRNFFFKKYTPKNSRQKQHHPG